MALSLVTHRWHLMICPRLFVGRFVNLATAGWLCCFSPFHPVRLVTQKCRNVGKKYQEKVHFVLRIQNATHTGSATQPDLFATFFAVVDLSQPGGHVLKGHC